MAGPGNADQIDYWNTVASKPWTHYQAQLDRQLDPLGRRAMQALAVQPGERVLDVGCGCGQTSVQLAEAAGSGGEVVGADISRPMLDVARQRTPPSGAAPLSFIEADAQEADLGQGRFDAAFSRFGVMFFADPKRAFANIGRALRPGGRLAFVCWRPFVENVWMSGPFYAAAAIVGAPAAPPTPRSPGPFAFAEAGYVEDILEAAGFTDVSVAGHDALIGSGDAAATLDLSLHVGGPLAVALREQPGLTPAAAKAVAAWLATHAVRTGDQVRLPAAVWIVTGRRPG
ncbi:MAG TPA: methyltransferase domain-containing protein [Caulobacteraceae bacterium]|jgi:SAM-dependent methyltransferase|nr:methyltransferase domain-containing protein [Caulobacteraceae bacterium]